MIIPNGLLNGVAARFSLKGSSPRSVNVDTPDDDWRERWRGRMPWILVVAVPLFIATISISVEIAARRYGIAAPHHRMILFGFNAALSVASGGVGGLFERQSLLDRVWFGIHYAMGGVMIYCVPLTVFFVALLVL